MTRKTCTVEDNVMYICFWDVNKKEKKKTREVEVTEDGEKVEVEALDEGNVVPLQDVSTEDFLKQKWVLTWFQFLIHHCHHLWVLSKHCTWNNIFVLFIVKTQDNMLPAMDGCFGDVQLPIVLS